MSQTVYKQWNTIKSHMEPADVAFIFLRTIILWGVAGWLVFSYVSQKTIGYVGSLIIFFIIYTIFIYLLLFFLPEKKRTIYGFSLFFDFLFTTLLARSTGGFESSFSNGFYLMTALYSFYFGPVAGAGIASAATLLYFLSGSFDFSKMYWTDFSVRIAFLFLLALPLGMLSQKLKRDKERIETLNKDLERHIEELHKVRKDV
ncbi:MAG: hypothetical protein KAJ34_05170 [Thermodesulfovibrionia bacterium]|nr:hypothetical protein [Thermodesulfovibrionia bacterium]